MVAALETELKRGVKFTGLSMHSLSRSFIKKWNIDGVGLSAFDGHEREPYSARFTGALRGWVV